MSDLPIIGYTNRLGAAAGDTVAVHVSVPSGRFDARLVRLDADPQTSEHVPSPIDGTYEGAQWPVTPGSHLYVEGGIPVPESPDISIHVFATLPADGREQGIVGWGESHGLFLDADGHVVARWGSAAASSRDPLVSHRWCRLRLQLIGARLRLTIGRHTRTHAETSHAETSESAVSAPRSSASAAAFRVASVSAGAGNDRHFDGKLARACIRDGSSIIADWNLGAQPQLRSVRDLSGNGRDALSVHRPQKGVTGPDWEGDTGGWSEAPDQYDAAAFHSDDLSDTGWPVAFNLVVPADLPSDAYGIELRAAGGRDVLPLFVTADEARRSKLAFLVPTFSYLAYANERHWWGSPAIEQITGKTLEEIVGPFDRWGESRRLLSVYDRHRDGSGNSHSSVLRPLVNMRPDYIHPLLRGPHQLGADLLTIAWLREAGEKFDLITDHCLHTRGIAALKGYRTVITGSHPEYVSREIVDAMDAYVERGGRVMHLGGNAFYFVVATYPDEPHIMEVRRGYAGTIAWQSAPGEVRMAATGEMGGLWRWRGRSAHRLFGTGTAAYSFGAGRPYKRTAASYDPKYAWIFEGVTADEIDAPSRLMGGAAGFEFDAMRSDLGTPVETVCLGVAKDFDSLAFLASEDLLATGPLGAIESHMTFLERPDGGKVFSAPSIAWTGGLGANGGNNDVARVTANILRNFMG